MIHKTIATVIVACLSLTCSAQDNSDQTSEKSVNHYLGLQANQLFRQIFNLNNSSPNVNNPYLVNYAVVFGPKKIGFNVGLGYSFDVIEDGGPTNERKTDLDDVFHRIGFEKRSYLTKNLMVGWGVDILNDKLSNETTNKSEFGTSKSEVTTNTVQKVIGFGPRLVLSYDILRSEDGSKVLQIGTEASYYYRSIKETEDRITKTTFFDGSTTVTQTDREDNDSKFKKLQLAVPAVLWLHLNF